MLRPLLFAFAIGTVGILACVARPVYEPWTPRAAPVMEAEAAAPVEVDDGSRPMDVPAGDDSLLSIVGRPPSAAAPTTSPSRIRARPAARRPRVATGAPRPSAPAPAPTATTITTKAQPAPTESAPAPAPDPMRAEAKAFFGARCVPCHGDRGRGDGPTGKVLTPTPRNFADKAWQRSVTDAHIEKVILGGGPSIGKSPLMPAHSDLGDQPELLDAMRRLVRDFGR